MSKIIWRICETSFVDSAFSGEGASIVGGRWNSSEIPDDVSIEYMDINRLPSNWYLSSSKPLLQKIGDEWLNIGETLILAVPSAIVPQELNYLINPLHPQFDRLIINPAQSFNFDRRMWK